MRECYGCDLRGLLSFQILFLLSKRSMHGEQIAMEIAKRRGYKPKASTIYPALKDLKGKGLIKGERSGKIIEYSLTPRGRRASHVAVGYFVHSFADVFER